MIVALTALLAAWAAVSLTETGPLARKLDEVKGKAEPVDAFLLHSL